ncbi:hypothetical protein [Novacetimonas hansenii]|uniref:hypothetical protein n=1 Tax=Novacetimonas hansenii TaxID=436 RepID=UPI000B0E6100|nr:hypothetical protein [Novacetimonas hansenii]
MENYSDKADKLAIKIANLIRNIHEISAPILVPTVTLFWPVYWAFEKDYFQGKPESTLHEFIRYVIIFIWFLVFVYINYRAVKRTGSITRLKKENSELKEKIDETNSTVTELNDCVREAWRLFLRVISEGIKLDNSFRVSIFRKNEEVFVMLGRYSEVDRYALRGRATHDIKCGCIGKAWISSNFENYIDNLPDKSDQYNDYMCQDFDYTLSEARKMRMRARSIYAFTIKDHDRHNVAVIVFESVNAHAIDIDILRKAVRETYKDHILSCLNALKSVEPSLSVALSKGF